MACARHLPVLLVAIAAFLATGCEIFSEPDPPVAGVGQRALIIPITNNSAQPARLLVAEDTSPVGRSVGVAHPAVVPPGAGVDVTFIVPNAPDWAIFVNPGGGTGPLLTASDLERCTGRVPILVEVSRDGLTWGGVGGAGLPCDGQ